MNNQTPDKYEEELISRIAECEMVIQDLEKSPAWQVVIKDLNRWIEQIDNNWHMANEEQIKELRIDKFAVNKIRQLALGYAQDLKTCREELDKLQNPDDNMLRDFDNESAFEQE